MNILILNWRDIKNPKSGGAEIVTMEHAKGWIENGYNVTWFTSEFKKGKRKEIVNGVEMIRRGSSVSVYLLAPFFYLRNKKKFDVVVDEIHGIPFFTPLYVRQPKIALIHEVAGEIWDYMYPFPINKIGKLIEPFYFKLYKNIPFWVPCESTVKDLEEKGIKRSNCKKVLCAIKNETLDTLPKEKEKTPTFIFVSRVVKMKGVEDVIKAFALILQKQPHSKLWIVGDGDSEYVSSLKKMIEKESITYKVKFFGKVSEEKKLELMRKAHLLLHASVKEGWGLVTVEAASQGTPAVVYNVAGLRDSVLNDKTGIVISTNTPQELGKAALSLYQNKEKYREFQLNGLKWARSLNWDKAISQSVNLINEVIKK